MPDVLAELRRRLHRAPSAGMQIYLSIGGRPVLDVGLGEARPGVPMSGSSLLPWSCASKPLVAIAVAQCWERELLDLDEPVASFLPAFGTGGKHDVTVRHVLTHTGGFRHVGGAPAALQDRQAYLDRACETPLEEGWVPGAVAGYHVDSGWYALAAVVERVTGVAIDEYVRERVCLRAGLCDTWMGMDAGTFQRLATRMGVMLDPVATGMRARPFLTSEAGCTRCQPAQGGVGPARELGQLYEALLSTLDGEEDGLISQATATLFLGRSRVGLYDRTFERQCDWTLGFQCNLSHHYGYPDGLGERSFGHSGQVGGVYALADPDSSVVCVIASSGVLRRWQDTRAVLAALLEVALAADVGGRCQKS